MATKLSAFSTMAFFALLHPLLAFAQQAQQPVDPQQQPWVWPGPWHMWSGGWGFWWILPLIMLFMIIACVAIFLLGRRSGGGGPHHWGPPAHMMDRPWGDPTYSALLILNDRFAKGEIQQEEYEAKRAVIRASGQH